MPSTVVPDFLGDLETPVSVPDGQIKRIAIIGGGASGAIALDSLVKEQKFDEIVLFERRDTYGGIWVLDESPKAAHELIKAGALTDELDPPLYNPFDDEKAPRIRRIADGQERFVHTPCYNGMLTNIIENMMTYSDEKAWKSGEQNRYVDRGDVRNYIDRYISRHQENSSVKLVKKTAVEDVQRVVNSEKAIPYDFLLTLRHQLQDATEEWYQEKFDAVVVATGHYHVPFIPATPGLEKIQEKWPSVVQHAKYYRNSAPYKDKTVVVVGARALGADLTKYAAETANKVYQLVREETGQQRKSRRPNVEIRPGILEIKVDDDGFSVVFNNGTTVDNPDHIVYATGYQFSFPFLKREYGNITRNGIIIPSLYQHTFLIDEPLLLILGVPTDAISFRAFEFQAILAARYLSSRVSLPSRKEQLLWAEKRLQEKGERRAYHTIGAFDALEYMRTLTALGALKGQEPVGREFPEITEQEVQEYAEAGAKLKENWDLPRV